MTLPSLPESDLAHVALLREAYGSLRTQIAKAIVGLESVTEQIFTTMICRGHCILEGVPGLAKTKLISTLASLTSLSFRRIQFTPDLMPADITGSDVLEEDPVSGRRIFRFVQGPLFGNVILADEINRTPPKTQSALLEAMEERQLTVGGHSHRLHDPFFVLATQNPLDQEGTYTLPEAQLDRFMLKIVLDYPSAEEELEIIRRASGEAAVRLEPLLSAEQLLTFQGLVRRVPIAEPALAYAAGIVRKSRPKGTEIPDSCRGLIRWGAGPRASIFLVLAAKARALLQGRHHATTGDVAAMALPVLRHRIMPTFQAEADGISPDSIVQRLL